MNMIGPFLIDLQLSSYCQLDVVCDLVEITSGLRKGPFHLDSHIYSCPPQCISICCT